MSKTSRTKLSVFLAAGIAAVILAAALSVFYGSTKIPFETVLQALRAPDMTDQQQIIIHELRIPRTIGCILVGAAFAVAGAIMQGVTRNPLADSGLLGINAGASFALAVCLAFLPSLSFSGVVLFSFLGAAVAMVVVYGLMSIKHRKLDPVRLVLAGSAVSVFLSSLSQAISIFYNIGYDLTFWTAGGVAGIRAKQLTFAAPVILVGLLLSLLLSRQISLLSLGDDVARGLGLEIDRIRTLCLFVVLLLAGGAWHWPAGGLCRLAGAPCGALFCGCGLPCHHPQFHAGRCILYAGGDLISRTINAPSETPVGLVFAVSVCHSLSGQPERRNAVLTEKTKRRSRTAGVLLILAVLLLVLIWLDINAGYQQITLTQLWQIICGKGEKGVTYTLVNLRLPRVLTSLLVGVGLSAAGCVLQGVSRNEMAEPGILGINAGAGLFIAAYIVLFSGSSVTYSILLPILAFAGSICTAAVDYFLSLTRQGLSPRRLLLVGIAMSTAISSATTMLMLRMSDSEYAFVQNWLSGSIWGANWQNVTLLTIGLALLLLAVFYKSRTLNVLVLGQQTATGLGVDVPRQTVLLLAAAIGMSSLCCSVGGGLSFVGLVCPHLARRLVGPNYRVLLGTTVLTGGVLMVFSDIISRTLLSPNEIPIGIVAAVIGAPYFLYLLVKS